MAKIALSTSKNGSARRTGSALSASQQAQVEKLAYQFFVERGCEHGHDQEDWLRAEAIVRNQNK